MARYVALAALCCCFLGGACRRTSPSGLEILSEDTMRVVLWEMFQADAYNETKAYKDTNYRHDTAFASLYLRIFDSHHISREQFADSYEYYLSDPARMKEIIDTLFDRNTRDMQKRGIFQSPYQRPMPVGRPPVMPNGRPPYPMGHPGSPQPRFVPGPHPPPGQRPPAPGKPAPGKPAKAISKPKSVV